MSNPLPPGAIPKLWRNRNKDGKEIGSWCIHIKKKPVNLRTQDYMKARERAREALQGKRDFTDDRYFGEEAQSEPAPKVAEVPLETGTAPPTTGDWTVDAAKAASAGLEPDAYFPPKALPPISDTTSTSTKPDEPKAKPDEASTSLPPEMLDGLVKQVAAMLVELQISGQEWLAVRWGGFQPGTVPPDSEARRLPTAIWEAQVRKWIPTDVPLPEWLVAPILVAALTVPIQLAGATPLKKENEPS